jgi:predicted Kef-type K+ transport protein
MNLRRETPGRSCTPVNLLRCTSKVVAVDIFWIGIAFAGGIIARFLRLPTIVGYLIAGLVLSIVGVPSGSDIIVLLGDIGVALLLFTVGLHLRLKSILQPEVFGVGSIHLVISALVFCGIGVLAGWSLVTAIVVGIALGFSSTVLAAKSLEARGEINAYHGRIAIGILIIQDVVAIGLMAVSSGGRPSPLAAGLVALVLIRPVLIRLLVWSGTEELLLVYGLLLALGVGVLFEAVGLDSKLGALVGGLLLSGHPQADELYEKLWALKEVFLVGFFLQVGLTGLPPLSEVPLLLVLFALLPLKGLLFFGSFLAFRLTARTAFMSSTTLTAYSEFALIVVSAGVASGTIPPTSLSMITLLVTMSFIVNTLLSRFVEPLWERIDQSAGRVEPDVVHPERIPASIGLTRYLIVGMGRAGTAAYDYFHEQGQRPLGVDSDPEKVEAHLLVGRRVIYADSQDANFWGAFSMSNVSAILLLIPDKLRKMRTSQLIRDTGYRGHIHALVRYDEDISDLLASGVNEASQPVSQAAREIAISMVGSPTAGAK